MAKHLSDMREKTDIKSTDLGLEFINTLRPVSYIWRNYPDDDKHYGLIAQEVKTSFSQFTDEFGGWSLSDPTDINSTQYINYSEFVAPLIKAVQELSEQNAWLEKRIAHLELLSISSPETHKAAAVCTKENEGLQYISSKPSVSLQRQTSAERIKTI